MKEDTDRNRKTDYLVLVNRQNPLPENWEKTLKTVHVFNSLGDDVEIEAKTCEAYLALRAKLEENGIFAELDSALRTMEAQQDIMERFTAEYGAAYAAKTVAPAGCSEHHTGLAVDLYLRIGGKDIYTNEELVLYTEEWKQIHETIAAYGFILRYPKDKEHITGYGYEPWHLRYVQQADIAKEIMERQITLEEYLGAVREYEPEIILDHSKLYSPEDLLEAAVQIKCVFAAWKNCELRMLAYCGDENALKHNQDPQCGYEHYAEFVMRYDVLPEEKEYECTFLSGRTKEGGWDIIRKES